METNWSIKNVSSILTSNSLPTVCQVVNNRDLIQFRSIYFLSFISIQVMGEIEKESGEREIKRNHSQLQIPTHKYLIHVWMFCNDRRKDSQNCQKQRNKDEKEKRIKWSKNTIRTFKERWLVTPSNEQKKKK